MFLLCYMNNVTPANLSCFGSLLLLVSPPPFAASPLTHQAGAFKRNFSSPLLSIDPLGVVREAPAAQGEWWNHEAAWRIAASQNVDVPASKHRFLTVAGFILCLVEADNVIVDPVYEALRYGTSLAQMSRSSFGSVSESPCHEVENVQPLLWMMWISMRNITWYFLYYRQKNFRKN